MKKEFKALCRKVFGASSLPLPPGCAVIFYQPRRPVNGIKDTK